MVPSVFMHSRQFDAKSAAASDDRLDADFSAHALHRFGDDGQTDPGAFIAGAGGGALEHSKDFLVVLRINADAVVVEERFDV